MPYHIALHRPIDAAVSGPAIDRGDEPRQAMLDLGQQLDATIHAAGGRSVGLLDRTLGSLIGGADAWALARALRRELTHEDRLFCNSEAVGFPLAAVFLWKRSRPKIAVFVHNIDRPKARVALKAFALGRGPDLFLGCSTTQVEFLRRCLGVGRDRAAFVWDGIDLSFFSPGPPSAGKTRPVIAAVGLEQRDYRTVAAATSDLEVDVRISGFSVDAQSTRSLPPTLPPNMNKRFYKWPELVQLYRDADVVVVSLFENRYAAGVQAVMEAQACRRPVVLTATSGLAAYSGDGVTVIPPGEPEAMREAIHRLLDAPEEADALADRGHRAAVSRYGIDRLVDALTAHVKRL